MIALVAWAQASAIIAQIVCGTYLVQHQHHWIGVLLMLNAGLSTITYSKSDQ